MGLLQTSCPIRARLLLQKLISLSSGWMPPGSLLYFEGFYLAVRNADLVHDVSIAQAVDWL